MSLSADDNAKQKCHSNRQCRKSNYNIYVINKIFFNS